MALLKTTEVYGGLSVNDAYHRIDKIEMKIESDVTISFSYDEDDNESTENITENRSSFTVGLAVYKDSAYRRADESAPEKLRTLNFNIPFSVLASLTTSDEESIKTKIYAYLKTLPEYAGATDA